MEKIVADRQSVTIVIQNIVLEYRVMMPHITNVNLTNCQAGLINTGSIEDVQSIDAYISNLKASGAHEIALSICNLSQAVIDSTEFRSERDRENLLQQIDFLAQQAAMEKSQRKAGVVKMALSSVAGTCATLGGIAAVWQTWGPSIEAFFLK